jgi:hypothetical protein
MLVAVNKGKACAANRYGPGTNRGYNPYLTTGGAISPRER